MHTQEGAPPVKHLLNDLPVSDHLTKMEIADKLLDAPHEQLVTALNEVESTGDQMAVAATLLDKWIEDRADDSAPVWDDAHPTLLALRDAKLAAWEAENRQELASPMQFARMDYCCLIAPLAALRKDGLHELVKRTLAQELVESDVGTDARAALKRWFQSE